MKIEELEEKRRSAKAIIDAATQPGGTEATGWLHLPGFGFYDYEPDRLIRDDHGFIIEQDKAPLSFKIAESNRAAKQLDEAMKHGGEEQLAEAIMWANRTRREADLFAVWVIEEQGKGRQDKLTFGDFIREAGLLKE